MMSFQVLLVVLLSFLLAVTVSAQCGTTNEQCVAVNFANTMATNNLAVTLTLTFAPPLVGSVFYGTGPICAVSGLITDSRSGPSSTSAFTITGGVGTLTDNSVGVITDIELTSLTITGFSGTATLEGAPGSTLSLVFSGVPGSPNGLPVMGPDTCNGAGVGDPWFTGFLGQHFLVAGEVGGVMNVLSSFNLQLNTRMISLAEGEAMTPTEQEQLRILSEIRHASDPSIPVLPTTWPWNHAGNYFSEAGVAMVDGHQLYVQAGLYRDGCSAVTLDGQDLPPSDQLIMVGSDINMINITRTSAHIVVVQTMSMEFSLICSDHFLNVERVHMEPNYHGHRHFAGVLGTTADSKWRFSENIEKEAMVESKNLFEFVPQPF